jgi:hypothetical protein
MTDTDKINAALQSQTDWTYPWKFLENVLAHPGLGPFERNLTQSIWTEAFNDKYWRSTELAECVQHIETGLAKKYPWLSAQSCKNLARAASYERK